MKGAADQTNGYMQPQKLAKLVGYQKGAVVSREIIMKERGTVTVFAFDKGQGLSEHTAPFDALIYILDGKTKITISGKAYNAAKGDIVVLPANKPHALKAAGRFKMLLVLIQSR